MDNFSAFPEAYVAADHINKKTIRKMRRFVQAPKNPEAQVFGIDRSRIIKKAGNFPGVPFRVAGLHNVYHVERTTTGAQDYETDK